MAERIQTYPYIVLELFTLEDIGAEDVAKRFFELLNEFGMDYWPDKYDVKDPVRNKIKHGQFEPMLEAWLKKEQHKEWEILGYEEAGSWLMMKKSKGHQCNYHVSWKRCKEQRFNYFSMMMSIDYLQQEGTMAVFLENCKSLIKLLKPVYGTIYNWSILEKRRAPDLKVIAPELDWTVIFGRPYIDMFGREKLLETPCYHVEEIEEDYIAIQLQENIFQQVSPEIRQRVKGHLGISAFVEAGCSYIDYLDKNTLAPNFDFSKLTFKKIYT